MIKVNSSVFQVIKSQFHIELHIRICLDLVKGIIISPRVSDSYVLNTENQALTSRLCPSNQNFTLSFRFEYTGFCKCMTYSTHRTIRN